MNNDQLWKATLDQLELRVSKGNFLTWFQKIQFKGRDGHTAVIETESPFIHIWISKKYGAVILETLRGLDSDIQDIQFRASSQNINRGPAVLQKNDRIIAQKIRPTPQQPTEQVRESSPLPSRRAHRLSVPLNPKYVFDTYVVGPSNEIAHAACQAVASKPGESYNPLFIYGGVGLGKTHLLQSVGNALTKTHPHFVILYVASEKFANEFVQSLRSSTTQQFKKRYRDLDLLIIDDIQFFAGKGKIQEELFHTFNSLHSQGKQVILSSDRPPSSIPALQERLSSRLSAGMIADIKKPDYETRLAILEEKKEQHDMKIDQDALAFIAKNVQSNVRELEGALNRVAAHCDLHNTRATLEYTQGVLQELLTQSHQKTMNTDQIINAVSVYYNLSIEDLCGKSRKKEIVRPRQVAMYLLRKESSMSFPSIGDHFNGRDHTTAMHACEKIEKLIEQDEELTQEINFLKERIYA